VSGDNEIVPASLAARRRWILFILASLLLLVGLFAIGQSLPRVPESATLPEIERALDRIFAFRAAQSAWVAAFSAVLAVYYGRLARRISRFGAFPPPGVEMPFALKRQAGPRTRTYGLAFWACSIFSTAIAATSLYTAFLWFAA
jgi:hypothetical protein